LIIVITEATTRSLRMLAVDGVHGITTQPLPSLCVGTILSLGGFPPGVVRQP
jgi:hypothetical protein